LTPQGEAIQLFRLVDVNGDILEAAKEIFKKDADLKLSFVDAVSLAVMQTYKIRGFFAFDEHFQRSGFESVLT
jgi:predicted nucleic acid-binding protein